MKNILKAVLICSIIFSACTKENQSVTSDRTAQGTNGSLTRFAIKDNFMYALDVNYMKVFDISTGSDPILVNSVKINYGLETITIYGEYVYIGAHDRIYMVGINDPSQPLEYDEMQHDISCDPVVVQGNYAYSTQNSFEVGCGHATSQSILAVYNVSNPQQTNLLKSITMTSPYGLAVEGKNLYVCDSEEGVIVYNISNPESPQALSTIPVANSRDIILNFPYMIISTQTSFEMYNYQDVNNIYHVSTFQLK